MSSHLGVTSIFQLVTQKRNVFIQRGKNMNYKN
jgi:hypothetical protein